jgi:hypothetical protein
MFADVGFVSEERYRRVVPPRNGKAAHNSAHHRGRYKCWMDSAAVSTLQFWPRTIKLLPVGYIKNRLRGHLALVTMHCGIPWASDCTGGRELTAKKYMLLFTGGRRPLAMIQTALKNNCAFSNAVVSFCEMFTCLTCQWQETNNTGNLMCGW